MAGKLVSAGWIWLIAAACAGGEPSIGDVLERIDKPDLQRHCGTLAADSLEGREAGRRGGKAAAAYLLTQLKTYRAQPAGERGGWGQEFGPEYRNLLAALPGTDEALNEDVIVIGAHYDHVGFGNAANSYGPLGQIHNGADDNASGVAALLEILQALSDGGYRPRRTLLFAFWDAEESGLLGSKHWVANPTLPKERVRIALNLDMLGRLRDDRLVVTGWRSAPGLRRILCGENRPAGLLLSFSPKVISDSDHYSFYAAGMPVLHFDTAMHPDYHRPTDDADKLSYDGLERIARLIASTLIALDRQETLPAFRPAAIKEKYETVATKPARRNAPRLGVTWNRKLSDTGVFEVVSVTPGSPADEAGVKPKDRIVSFNGVSPRDDRNLYRLILSAENPVRLRLQRPGGGKELEFRVRLKGEPVRVGITWLEDTALPGAIVITEVVADSPADAAGLERGDILWKLNDESFSPPEKVRERLVSSPGPLRFERERSGRLDEVEVELP